MIQFYVCVLLCRESVESKAVKQSINSFSNNVKDQLMQKVGLSILLILWYSLFKNRLLNPEWLNTVKNLVGNVHEWGTQIKLLFFFTSGAS